MAQQTADAVRVQLEAPIAPTLDQLDLIARLDRRATSGISWPLSATLLPNARLSWAAWLDAQSRQAVATRQDAFEQAVEAQQTAA
jgi:hypothetical protein